MYDSAELGLTPIRIANKIIENTEDRVSSIVFLFGRWSIIENYTIEFLFSSKYILPETSICTL